MVSTHLGTKVAFPSFLRRGCRRGHIPNPTLSIRELLAAAIRPSQISDAERTIRGVFPDGHVVLFASARGALAAAVEVLSPGGRVAIPAYTCIAVPNAVRSAGARIVYVDIASSGIVPADAWPAADLVIAQNTFGLSASVVPYGRPVIQDVAHRVDLLSPLQADVAITSFEHSKWLSAGQGGLALVRDASLADRIRAKRDENVHSTRYLDHLFITLLTLMIGRIEYGGRYPGAATLRRLTSHLAPARMRGQSEEELRGGGVEPTLRGRPNGGAARLMTTQLRKLGAVANHRKHLVLLYDEAAGIKREPEPLVRYPMTVNDPSWFEAEFRLRGWDISGRWFAAPLHPATTILEDFGYSGGMAPRAEALSSTVVNLPTHPLVTGAEAQTLIEIALELGAKPLNSGQGAHDAH